MKKIFAIAALFAAMLATGCSNGSKADREPMSDSMLEATLKPLYDKLMSISDTEAGMDSVKELSLEFVKNNENEAGVYVIRGVLTQLMEPAELLKFIDSNDFYKNDSTVIALRSGIEALMATQEGSMFKDFEAEYDGKVTKLSDYVGKGKYVLVDFWASWCGPCRMEIPNIIKVYDQYKGDKFEVLGVATWDEPENTLAAIEEMGIKYPQMLNAQAAGSDAYGINGIPEIILFAPDGKIVKRGLRGEDIEKAVVEALK